MFPRRPPQYHQIIDSQPASLSEDASAFNVDENGCPSGPTFSDSRYQLPYGRGIYNSSIFASQNTRGFMSAAGEFAFTASQRKELERQLMICKYMMASVPIPSQLLLSPTSASHIKFSSGSDPEPWRCRRTDGKKWRCTRNAAPDHKYCERHAQKTKSRSRKPVEIQPPIPRTNYSPQPLGIGVNNTSSRNFVNMMNQFPSMASATPYVKTRGIECITRDSGGPVAVSLYNQQRQQLMQSSSNSNGSLSLLPCLDAGCERYENHLLDKPYCDTVVDPEMGSFLGSRNGYTTQGTKPLFDAWSTGERGGPVEISKEASASSSTRLPFCSLSLLTPGADKIDENEWSVMSTEMIDSVSWRGTTPGGPLGEALCLGLENNERGSSNFVSPHCYSTSTTTSSCSRSSCEDGSQAFNFIG